MKQHRYKVDIEWTGNTGKGTESYTSYERKHTISVDEKPIIHCSSDPAFRGDKTRYNPEELFVASLSTCHMLWFLHLCSDAKINVTHYTDTAKGIMEETADGGGRFKEVTLHPIVTITDKAMVEKANKLHERANTLCFIANSCNFPVHHQPTCRAKDE